MPGGKPAADRPMTADDVLLALRESLRQQVEYDPEAVCTELTFETTVARWRDACDLVPSRDLGPALNQHFETDFSDAEWIAALLPEKQRTLRDVCDLLATGARAPLVDSRCILGAKCRAAGAFLVLREALQKSGADVSALRPGTRTAEWLRRHVGVVLRLAEKIAPGKLPPVRIVNNQYDAAIAALLAGWVLLIAAWCGSYFGPWIPLCVTPLGGLLALAGYLCTSLAAGKPNSVAFGEIETFRELSYALVGETPPRRNRSKRTN